MVTGLALVAGVPIRVLADRELFARVSDGIGVAVDPVVPLLALAAVVAGGTAPAVLGAALQGRVAARVRPSLLRAE